MTTKAKAAHPADVANAEMIDKAARFEISLFLGTGRFCKDTAKSVAEARQKGDAMMLANPLCSRKPIIYAIGADNRSAVVPPAEPSDAMKILVANKEARQRAAALATPTEAQKETESMAKKPATKKPAAARKATPNKAAAKVAQARAPKATPKPAKAAAKAAKPADKKVATPVAVAKPTGQRAQILADAKAGKMPKAPDFTAATHERFRPKLAEVVALAKAGDIKGLKTYAINPVSSSPKAIAKYRDLCVIALEARAKTSKAA